MKYKEVTIEKAREICRKSKSNCEKCALRRVDTKRNKTLLCYFILKEIVNEIDLNEMQEEEIINYEELE